MRVKILMSSIFTLFDYIFLYAFPHSTMESRIGLRVLPKSLNAYSTRGGTSGYYAGFYPFPDEESYWGYWSKQALLGGINLDVTPLHKLLLEALSEKKIFVLSTNADAQFVKAGLPDEKIFCTQGDYFHIQCGRGCHDKIYDAVDLFHQMDQARIDCKIPTDLVPKCPVCGGPMDMNLRKDNFFVQDDAWHKAEDRFSDFLSDAINEELVLLELGVGFNTPTIIRFPFEKLVREHDNISLIRLNLNQAVIPKSFGSRGIGINADMAESIEDIVEEVKNSLHFLDNLTVDRYNLPNDC